MIPLAVTLDLDKTPWTDLRSAWGEMATIERVGRLPKGTVEGNSVVALALKLPDDSIVFAQTTMANFLGAAALLHAVDNPGKG